MIRVFIFLGLILLIILSCSGLSNKKKITGKKIKELVLYNTISESLNADIKDLSQYPNKSFSDSETVSLLGNAVSVSGNYIWKGFVIGLIRYEDGDSAKIRVSRYGGFFKSLSDNRYYSFSNQTSTEKWKTLVDSFIDETFK